MGAVTRNVGAGVPHLVLLLDIINGFGQCVETILLYSLGLLRPESMAWLPNTGT